MGTRSCLNFDVDASRRRKEEGMRWFEMLLWGGVDIPNRVFYPLVVFLFILGVVALVYGDEQIQQWLKEVVKR